MYSTKELIKLLKNTNIYTTISNKKITKVNKTEQFPLSGYNFAGRPSGIYYANEGEWLEYLISNKTQKDFTDCCYLYEIIPKKDKIFDINKKYKEIEYFYYNSHNFNFIYQTLYKKTIENTKLDDSLVYIPTKIEYDTLKKYRIIFDKRQHAIDAFYDTYGIFLRDNFVDAYRMPRWDIVAKKYCGAYIGNLDKYKKLYFWVDSFSIPSGVIWDLKALKSKPQLIASKNKKNKKWKITNEYKFLIN